MTDMKSSGQSFGMAGALPHDLLETIFENVPPTYVLPASSLRFRISRLTETPRFSPMPRAYIAQKMWYHNQCLPVEREHMGHPLVACGVANKYWHAITQKHIYNAVFLSSPHQAKCFLRSISANPRLLGLISSFNLGRFLGAINEVGDNYMEEWSAVQWDILARLEPVYHLGLSTWSLFPEPSDEAIDKPPPRKILEGLKSLALDVRCASHLGSWIGIAAPTLERLQCDTAYSFVIKPVTPHLRSLSLTSCFLESMEFLDGLLGSGNATPLEDLCLRISRDSAQLGSNLGTILQRQAPSLRRLSLFVADVGHWPNLLTDIATALPRMCNLWFLSLELRVYFWHNVGDLSPLWAALPLQLRELHILGFRSGFAALLEQGRMICARAPELKLYKLVLMEPGTLEGTVPVHVQALEKEASRYALSRGVELVFRTAGLGQLEWVFTDSSKYPVEP
jgi:hypothetical protein